MFMSTWFYLRCVMTVYKRYSLTISVFSQDTEKNILKGKLFNWSIRGTLDYLLELNRSTDVANCQSWSPPRNYSGEIVGSILPMERDPLRENPFRARGRHLGVWTSCYDDGESAPLIITTLEILLLQDTPWTISRVAKHAISESRAATLKYLASRRRMVRCRRPGGGCDIEWNRGDEIVCHVISFVTLAFESSP